MYPGIETFLILAQSDEGPGGGLNTLIFLLIFVGLSALSSLLKRKKEKSDSTPKQQPRTPAAPAQTRQPQIPGYPRKTTQIPTSQTRTPSTTQRPRPTAQRPIPSSQRPASPTRQPQQRPQQEQPRPAIRPIPEQTSSKPRHSTHAQKTAAAQKRHVAPKTKTPAQIAAKLKKSINSGTSRTSSTSAPASDNIKLGLDQQDSLVRAILYAEILDIPMALRRSGSHDFLDY